MTTMTGHTDKSAADIADDLRDLAFTMAQRAQDLEYYGGLNPEILDKAKQMAVSSAIVLTWASGIEQAAT